jgi:hypothetical protein
MRRSRVIQIVGIPKGFTRSKDRMSTEHLHWRLPLHLQVRRKWSGAAWLNQSELQECVTYHVRGFHRISHWPLSIFCPERGILPAIKGPDAVYRFRTGETILMKVLQIRSGERCSVKSSDKS